MVTIMYLVVTTNTKETFSNLIEQSGKRLDPSSRAALYEEFKTQKAVKELEQELEKLVINIVATST